MTASPEDGYPPRDRVRPQPTGRRGVGDGGREPEEEALSAKDVEEDSGVPPSSRVSAASHGNLDECRAHGVGAAAVAGRTRSPYALPLLQ